jgi:hypothetical protein
LGNFLLDVGLYEEDSSTEGDWRERKIYVPSVAERALLVQLTEEDCVSGEELDGGVKEVGTNSLARVFKLNDLAFGSS